jgi:hypothetical protein
VYPVVTITGLSRSIFFALSKFLLGQECNIQRRPFGDGRSMVLSSIHAHCTEFIHPAAQLEAAVSLLSLAPLYSLKHVLNLKVGTWT